MPTFVSDSILTPPVGSVNLNSSPQSLAAPAGLAAGHLLVVGIWPAQGLGGSNTITTPASTTKATVDGANPERLAALYVAKVVNPADFSGGITISTSSFSSRISAVAQAWAPDSGYEWDLTSLIAAGPEWNGSAASSDTYPALTTRDLMLGALFTNKGASTTLTTHTADGGGTNMSQCRSVSAASGSVSDSVVSLTRGGTGVSYNISQANGIAYSIGVNQVVTGGGGGLPTVTEPGFSTVQQMLRTRGATWAHRNLGGTYPEMTEYGVRSAANDGFGCIEISCQRTSDGVWVGSHDQTPNRVALQTTHDGTNISALTSAQVLAMDVNVGTTGGPQPFATLTELVETLPEDYIFLVDPKQSGDNATYRDEFLDLVDTLLGPTRAIIKLDVYANINSFIDAKARGYVTAAYLYAAPSSPSDPGIVSARMPYIDLPGLNHDASAGDWTSLMATYPGKKWWGHVAASQANYDSAVSKGASFVQCTSASIAPVGFSVWRPGVLSDGFAPTEIYAGSTLIQKVYQGSTLVWTRA